MIAQPRIVICGFGNVGRAFARLVDEKGDFLRRRYGIDASIAAIADIGGAAIDTGGGLSGSHMADRVEAGGRVETTEVVGHPGMSGVEAMAMVNADILIEATPTNLVDGEPATSHILAAFDKGMDAVTANKGPVVLFYRRLHAAARRAGKGLFISAATAAALPTLDVGAISTAGARIDAVDGILNGTTNFILSRMTETGCAYDKALTAAQEMGIAETDPTLDVAGLDTRNKLFLITSRLTGETIEPDSIVTVGITGVTPEAVRKAAAEGKVIKLLGTYRRKGDAGVLRVAPQAIDRSHPLASVAGSEKAISYLTDTMGRITVTGGHSSPKGAAAALLKDVIHSIVLPGLSPSPALDGGGASG
jgi:homoserine dehydrogenase